MSKEIGVVYNEKIATHNPPFDVYNGLHIPHFDTPQRAYEIINALRTLSDSQDVTISEPRAFNMQFIYNVHDEAYLAYIKRISERMASKPKVMVAEIIDPETRQTVVHEYDAFTYPSAFPHGRHPRSSSRQADQGVYAFDTLTPIMANTYELALNSAFIALTGAEQLIQGKQQVYAVCRPSGHHAERSRMGGYCYLNNAALAADYLHSVTGKKIAILDIDAHHGNGTQDIFYDSANVFYVSIHGDPSTTPPFYSGYEDEKGENTGNGYNLNIPLATGTDGQSYLEKLDYAISQIQQYAPGFIVISLGFDGSIDDPFKIFKITQDGYKQIGKKIGIVGIPTLSVQEGGYNPQSLGQNVYAYLRGLKES